MARIFLERTNGSAGMAISIHYGMTPSFSGTPQQYIQALGAAPGGVMAIEP